MLKGKVVYIALALLVILTILTFTLTYGKFEVGEGSFFGTLSENFKLIDTNDDSSFGNNWPYLIVIIGLFIGAGVLNFFKKDEFAKRLVVAAVTVSLVLFYQFNFNYSDTLQDMYKMSIGAFLHIVYMAFGVAFVMFHDKLEKM